MKFYSTSKIPSEIDSVRNSHTLKLSYFAYFSLFFIQLFSLSHRQPHFFYLNVILHACRRGWTEKLFRCCQKVEGERGKKSFHKHTKCNFLMPHSPRVCVCVIAYLRFFALHFEDLFASMSWWLLCSTKNSLCSCWKVKDALARNPTAVCFYDDLRQRTRKVFVRMFA